MKLPVDIVIGTIPIENIQSQKASYHPLPSIVNDEKCPFPFFEHLSDQIYLTSMSLTQQMIVQQMLPTAPPWESDDDIP